MGQALYRKYRPRKFAEVVGQSAVIETLAKAVKDGRISHAYLFSGPRGVGKTSVARILAHEVNQLPYSGETVHLDIIEIDAASNRRIDEIRDLRDKVSTVPTVAKYKVYIIDEVHMLTKEAFNALLKTLEEPPAHCIFILATTEPHKLPETIVSRTQRFNFKPVGVVEATKHISNIATKEKLAIEREALQLLAEFGEGSFRDSISLLDQLSASKGKITVAKILKLLGLPSSYIIEQLKQSTYRADLAKIAGLIEEIKGSSINSVYVANQMARSIRDDLINAKADNAIWLTDLLKQLGEVSAAKHPADKLEIVLFEAAVNSPNFQLSQPSRPIKPVLAKVEVAAQLTSPNVKKPPRIKDNPNIFSLEIWPKILQAVKDQAGSLHSALRLAAPSYKNGVLRLAFAFPFHLNKVKQADNIQRLAKIIKEISGNSVTIDCVVEKDATAPIEHRQTLTQDSTDNYQTISNIFGPAEMLES
ncbi:DNA polymerase III, subunit gamma and tau [Candidatus Saccharibacteria bacterium RIFCSPHIGHO2_12_FULL_47_16b]|nr:MAG: DNA polymerase III, subunit gamma and tau [Candidatus Saccharibacteria bacterium RIFCSPHIGHO2_12_FULL_47_16b]